MIYEENNYNPWTNIFRSYLAMGELADSVIERAEYDFRADKKRKPTKDEMIDFILEQFVPSLEMSIDEMFDDEEIG